MTAPKPFALIREMHETPGLLRRLDPNALSSWLPILHQAKHIVLTGEGSSRIFPAHNLIAQSLRHGHPQRFLTAGAREILGYDLRDSVLIGTSNSGRTRELIDLFTHTKTQRIPTFAVTATPDSPITALADHNLILSCGAEQAIAASKSVFEQALVYQSLLQGDEWQYQAQAADLCATILQQNVPDNIVQTVANANCIYIAGRNDGVAEELVLKATEIMRKKAVYLEGTYVLHGVEEILQPDDALILIEPFAQDFEKIQHIIGTGTHIPIIAIATAETPFPTFNIPALTGFNSYFQLLAGWQILVAAALANGLDLDHARRARKSGNAV